MKICSKGVHLPEIYSEMSDGLLTYLLEICFAIMKLELPTQVIPTYVMK